MSVLSSCKLHLIESFDEAQAFMDWFGNHKTEGYEFFLLAIGMSVALVLAGPGRLSLDARLSRQRHDA